jgi:hypothetical protein
VHIKHIQHELGCQALSIAVTRHKIANLNCFGSPLYLPDAGLLTLASGHKEDLMRSAIFILSLLTVIYVQTCLAADQTICNPGSDIYFYPNGILKSCELKDFFTANGVKCSQYSQIHFHEVGMLRRCVSSDFFVYNGISCNQYAEVSFYPSGQLDTCTLANQVVVEGKTCAALQPISLFENGTLRSCGTPQ